MLLYALLMLQQYENPCCTASNLNTPELCMVTTGEGGGGGLVPIQIMHRGILAQSMTACARRPFYSMHN